MAVILKFPPPSNPVPDGFTRMATVPVQSRDATGPKSWTIYHFNPWADIENRDVPDFQAVTVRLGCECNNNVRELPFFATLDQILSGSVIPEWG